jgi:hypothetical protein
MEVLPNRVIPIDITIETAEGIVMGNWSQMDPEAEPETCSNIREYINMTARERSERIMLLIDENGIANRLSQPTHVKVASDGGFDPLTGISSYGWIVAFNRTLVAKGRGPAEAHPDLAESFRSEGYGLASVAAFLMAMVTFFNIDPEEHSWKFYLDNKAMIQRMESYQANIPHSKWNLRSDSDITNKAHEYLRHIPAVLTHVKSHQDNGKEICTLSFDAQMNILADTLATQQRDQMFKPITRVSGDHCHLVIKDQYMTTSVFNSIHWEIQHKALRSYSQNDQRRILKFTHDWLPTNYRLFREKQEASPAC